MIVQFIGDDKYQPRVFYSTGFVMVHITSDSLTPIVATVEAVTQRFIYGFQINEAIRRHYHSSPFEHKLSACN